MTQETVGSVGLEVMGVKGESVRDVVVTVRVHEEVWWSRGKVRAIQTPVMVGETATISVESACISAPYTKLGPRQAHLH